MYIADLPLDGQSLMEEDAVRVLPIVSNSFIIFMLLSFLQVYISNSLDILVGLLLVKRETYSFMLSPSAILGIPFDLLEILTQENSGGVACIIRENHSGLARMRQG